MLISVVFMSSSFFTFRMDGLCYITQLRRVFMTHANFSLSVVQMLMLLLRYPPTEAIFTDFQIVMHDCAKVWISVRVLTDVKAGSE